MKDSIMKKHLVTATVIGSLLVSHVIVGVQFKAEAKEMDKRLQLQNELIYNMKGDNLKLNLDIHKQQKEIDSLSNSIKEKDSQIHSLKQQLENAKKRNESPSVSIPSRGDGKKQKKINVIATAYISNCYQCIGITATGKDVRNTIYSDGMRIIAADPNYIKLHSIVRVDTKNESFVAYVSDTGGKIKGYKIDILISVNDEQKAFDFGKQHATVTIIRDGKGGG